MPSLNRLFKLLSDKRRRHIIYILDDRNGPVALEELTAHLDDHPAIPESSDHLELGLYHNHLPTIADREYIQYDQENDFLELTHLPPKANAIIAVTKALEHPPT